MKLKYKLGKYERPSELASLPARHIDCYEGKYFHHQGKIVVYGKGCTKVANKVVESLNHH